MAHKHIPFFNIQDYLCKSTALYIHLYLFSSENFERFMANVFRFQSGPKMKIAFKRKSLTLSAMQCRYILFSVLFQTKSSLVWKSYTQKLCTISKPIPVWFGKKKIDFARRRFQTKFRLVWKILMTIVNVLKIPNQIQFGLEKSLTIANALNQFQFYFVKSHFRKGKNSNILVQD